MKFNIHPMRGFKNTYKKNDAGRFLPAWRKLQDKMYKGNISKDRNTIMITGNLPYNPNLQIVVLDFDGINHGSIHSLDVIINDLYEFNLTPYQIRESGNHGFHIIFICDINYSFSNTQNKQLNKSTMTRFYSQVGGIDIRGNGGIIYWDCKFSDTDEYKLLYQNEFHVTNTTKLRSYIDLLYNNKETTKISISTRFQMSKIDSIDINIFNYKDFGIPENKFPYYSLLRKAAQDIWTGAYQITQTNDEFKIWSFVWREFYYCGFEMDEIFNRFRSGVQPEYDEKETILQLKYLKPYMEYRPSTKIYNEIFGEDYDK